MLALAVLTETAFCARIGWPLAIAFWAVVINSGDEARIPIGCLDIPAWRNILLFNGLFINLAPFRY